MSQGSQQNMPTIFKYGQERAEVIQDSISDHDHRLISVEVTMARYVLAEYNTHRMFSRNSESSRAIPFNLRLQRVLNNPFVPPEWGQNAAGMSSREVLPEDEAEIADEVWHRALGYAALCAVSLVGGIEKLDSPEIKAIIEEKVGERWGEVEFLQNSNVHKQFVNRLLEPFMYHTVLTTATEWDNFFSLRIDEAAQPEIRRAAEAIKKAIDGSQPQELGEGEWHLPYIDDRLKSEVKDQEVLKKVAVARSARLSYLNQQRHEESLAQGEAMEKIVAADLKLFERLTSSGHMSPLEHVATPFTNWDWHKRHSRQVGLKKHDPYYKAQEFSGNFRGWEQYRKTIINEDDFSYQKGLKHPLKIQGG